MTQIPSKFTDRARCCLQASLVMAHMGNKKKQDLIQFVLVCSSFFLFFHPVWNHTLIMLMTEAEICIDVTVMRNRDLLSTDFSRRNYLSYCLIWFDAGWRTKGVPEPCPGKVSENCPRGYPRTMNIPYRKKALCCLFIVRGNKKIEKSLTSTMFHSLDPPRNGSFQTCT